MPRRYTQESKIPICYLEKELLDLIKSGSHIRHFSNDLNLLDSVGDIVPFTGFCTYRSRLIIVDVGMETNFHLLPEKTKELLYEEIINKRYK